MEQSKKILLVFALLAVIILGGLVFTMLQNQGENQSQYFTSQQNHSFQMPEFNKKTLLGHYLNDKDLLSKPYVLHVFAPWCSVCVQEMADLQNWGSRHHIRMIGVSFQSDVAATQALINQHPNTFEHVIMDDNGSLSTDLGITGTPQSFLVNADGMVVNHWIGPISSQRVAQQMLQSWQDLNLSS
ncbi:MAG: redoxin domain-containing protein [Candidatus Comchoanobacterales bacterium]